MNKKIRLATKDYNKLVNKKNDLDNEIARTQREKDLKVDTINKRYENKLEKLIRERKETEFILTSTKEFIAKN